MRLVWPHSGGKADRRLPRNPAEYADQSGIVCARKGPISLRASATACSIVIARPAVRAVAASTATPAAQLALPFAALDAPQQRPSPLELRIRRCDEPDRPHHLPLLAHHACQREQLHGDGLLCDAHARTLTLTVQ